MILKIKGISLNHTVEYDHPMQSGCFATTDIGTEVSQSANSIGLLRELLHELTKKQITYEQNSFIIC